MRGTTVQEPDEKETKDPCPECGLVTWHRILTIVNHEVCDAGGESFFYHYLTIQCNGCDTVSFCEASENTYEQSYDEQGNPFLPVMKRYYPQPLDESNYTKDFVDPTRIEAFEATSSKRFDIRKLVRLLVELNRSYAVNNYYACLMLMRAVIDHVPPLLGLKTFNEVANSYIGGGKSFKESMQYLNGPMRKDTDAYLHLPVRTRESLPTKASVRYEAALDILLREVVRVLEQQQC